MKKVFVVSTLILLASSLIFSSSVIAAPEKPIEFRLAHNSSPMSSASRNFIVPWTKKVNEVTNGRVKITVYPSQTLCKVKETIDATKTGITDMAWVIVGMFPRFRLSSVTSLPFLNLPSGTVDGRTLGPGAINSHILQELYEKFPEIQDEWKQAGVKPLMLHTGGPSFLFMSKKPVSNRADLKGMKIRELAGPAIDLWKTLGAVPVVMPMPPVYEALEKGIIDGAALDWGGTMGFRIYEVAKYRTDITISLGRFALIINNEKWNSLSPDIQEAIMGISGIKGAEFAGEGLVGARLSKAVHDKAGKAGRKIEEISLDSGELNNWKDVAAKPLWDKWVADMESKGLPGQKILDETLNLLKKYK